MLLPVSCILYYRLGDTDFHVLDRSSDLSDLSLKRNKTVAVDGGFSGFELRKISRWPIKLVVHL